MKKEFNKEYMLNNRGCYSESKLLRCQFMKTINDKKITIEQIIYSEINIQDKIWFLIRKTNLTNKQKKKISIDCAKIVLPIYEAKYKKSKSARKLIQACEDFLHGKIKLKELFETRKIISSYTRTRKIYFICSDFAYDSSLDAIDSVGSIYNDEIEGYAYSSICASLNSATFYADNKFNVELLNYLINFVKTN